MLGPSFSTSSSLFCRATSSICLSFFALPALAFVFPDYTGAQTCPITIELKFREVYPANAPFQVCFQVHVRPKQFIRIHIRQIGADAVATLFDSFNHQITDPPTDTVTEKEYEERVLFLADHEDTLKLVVSSADTSGRAEVELIEQRIPEESEMPLIRNLITAEREFVLASDILAKGTDTVDTLKPAIEHLSRALGNIPELSDVRHEELLLKSLFLASAKGFSSPSLRPALLPSASYLPLLKRAANICARQQKFECVYGYNVQYAALLPQVYSFDLDSHTKQGDKVVEELNQAIDIALKTAKEHNLNIEHPWMLANAYNNVGKYYIEESDTGRAHSSFQNARDIGAGTNEELIAIHNLGDCAFVEGHMQDALDYYDQAFNAFSTIKESTPEDTKAIQTELQTRSLISQARTYLSLTDIDTAEQTYKRALPYALAFKDTKKAYSTDPEAMIYHGLGVIYNIRQNYVEARRYFEKAESLRANEPRQLAETRTAIGRMLVDQGENSEALARTEQIIESLQKARAYNSQAYALMNKAEALRNLKRNKEALEALDTALKLIADKPGLASIHYLRAKVFVDQKDPKSALRELDSACSTIEFVRDHVAALEQKERYLDAAQKYYDFAVNAAVDLSKQDNSYAVEALNFAERARARALLDALAAAQVRLYAPDDPLAVEVSNLEAQLRRQMQELSRNSDETERQAIESRVNITKAKLQNSVTKLLDKYPRLKALRKPLRGAEIIRRLPRNTLLLEYRLMADRSVLFIVTHENGVRTEYLPSASEINTLAKSFTGSVSDENTTEEQFKKSAQDLAKAVLEQVPELKTYKRVYVVADGNLALVPFAALHNPFATGYSPLMLQTQAAMLPSSSILPASSRAAIKGKIVIFADPVFQLAEAQLRLKELKLQNRRRPAAEGPVAIHDRQGESTKRAVTDLGIEGKADPLQRLFETRREADLLCGIFGKNCGPVYRDFEASKSNAVGLPPLFAYIHFGTHGYLNTSNPYKSGLVLSLYNKDLTPIYGLLRLQDIYSLKLKAELVSLSACETASGQGSRAEGVNSLVRGFLFAGARNVLGTIWKIDSPATPEFMRLFYKGVVKDRLTPAEALRRTQEAFFVKDFRLSNKSQKPRRWSHPYYWAAFTIFGVSR